MDLSSVLFERALSTDGSNFSLVRVMTPELATTVALNAEMPREEHLAEDAATFRILETDSRGSLCHGVVSVAKDKSDDGGFTLDVEVAPDSKIASGKSPVLSEAVREAVVFAKTQLGAKAVAWVVKDGAFVAPAFAANFDLDRAVIGAGTPTLDEALAQICAKIKADGEVTLREPARTFNVVERARRIIQPTRKVADSNVVSVGLPNQISTFREVGTVIPVDARGSTEEVLDRLVEALHAIALPDAVEMRDISALAPTADALPGELDEMTGPWLSFRIVQHDQSQLLVTLENRPTIGNAIDARGISQAIYACAQLNIAFPGLIGQLNFGAVPGFDFDRDTNVGAVELPEDLIMNDPYGAARHVRDMRKTGEWPKTSSDEVTAFVHQSAMSLLVVLESAGFRHDGPLADLKKPTPVPKRVLDAATTKLGRLSGFSTREREDARSFVRTNENRTNKIRAFVSQCRDDLLANNPSINPALAEDLVELRVLAMKIWENELVGNSRDQDLRARIGSAISYVPPKLDNSSDNATAALEQATGFGRVTNSAKPSFNSTSYLDTIVNGLVGFLHGASGTMTAEYPLAAVRAHFTQVLRTGPDGKIIIDRTSKQAMR